MYTLTFDKKIPILVIAGPTASGKSALACAVAQQLNGEIISGDSMQVYRGMDIGTSKPSKEVLEQVPHHLVDILNISQSFSAQSFKTLAKQSAEEILSRKKLPILAGGTGLYIDMLIKDIILPEIRNNPALRAQLNSIAAEKGNLYLHEILASCDPASAAAIHPNNVKRVVRAIEIFRMTQVTMSEWNKRSMQKESDFAPFKVYLTANRQKLYDIIDARVDSFIQAGLEDEVRGLYEKGLASAPTASQAIGYKEFRQYIEGTASLDDTVALIKQNTRNYAKRQETYFAKMDFDLTFDAAVSNTSGQCEQICRAVNIQDTEGV